MAPQYRLHYFNIKALAEPIRLLFAYKNIEYEDVRVEFNEWPETKKTMPWGKMPVLEVSDEKLTMKLSQSIAILTFLAHRHGLAGSSEEEMAVCGEIVGAMNDLRSAAKATKDEPDAEKQAELMKKLFAETYPFYLGKFNDMIEKNGAYLVGKSVTYADLYVAHFLQLTCNVKPELLDAYPAVKGHQQAIFELPGIKEWVAKRPVTEW